MSDAPSAGSKRVARTGAALGLATALPAIVSATNAVVRVDQALFRVDPDLSDLFRMVVDLVGPAYSSALTLAILGTVVGAVVRTLARARMRAGMPDPLSGFRAFVTHRVRFAELTLVPSVLWTALLASHHYRMFADRSIYALLPGFVLPAALVLLANVLLARTGLRAMAAPTLDDEEAAGSQRETAEGFTFDAVAVTRETRAAVAGLALLSLVMAAVTVLLPVSAMRDPRFFAAVAAYVLTAAAGAAAFRSASRISVGLDGVLVKGSSRTRFFGFRELDSAQVSGGDLELMRGFHVVVRLQLHGKDATRRDALAERITAAITRANADRGAPEVGFVQGATEAELVNAAEGASSYRRVALSREQLWSVLESPALDPVARRAAAEALARSQDPSERTRFRVAAEQCAEPAVRVRMHELLEDDDEAAARAGKRMTVDSRPA